MIKQLRIPKARQKVLLAIMNDATVNASDDLEESFSPTSSLFAKGATASQIRSLFSPREMRIIELVCEGRRNSEIAARLKIPESVLRHYLRWIYDKAGIHDRLDLALLVLRSGILEPAAPEGNGDSEGEAPLRVALAS